MPGMILPDLQALPQHFQLAEKVGHRIRGGDPGGSFCTISVRAFSPHTRG